MSVTNLPSEEENPIPKVVLLIEELVGDENVRSAYKRVLENKGAAGCDRMPVEGLKEHLSDHWEILKAQLLMGTYQPSAVLQVLIPKPKGDQRKLGIPTVIDRMIQQCLLQILSPIFEPTFSDHSYGFRPNKSAQDAVKQSRIYIREGYNWVVDMDIAQFFDEVPHDILMGRNLGRFIKEYLNPLFRGWTDYFQLCETRKFAKELDQWLRHRLRKVIWQQAKGSYTRFKRLQSRGIDGVRAWESVTNGRGPWWNSGASHMNQAYPKSYFYKIGLVSIEDRLNYWKSRN